VVDGSENVYIVGNSASAGGDSSDIITLKYDASGNFQWEKRINNGGGDFGIAITLDNSNNVVVTGYTDADNSAAVNFNTVTLKYDATGSEKWTNNFNGISNLDDIADALASDQFGNVYVALHSNEGTATDINYNIIAIRYNTDGTEEWQVNYSGASDTLDVPNEILIADNDLYIAGSTWQNGNQRDMIVIKYVNVTAVNDIASEEATVNVFPNPTSDELTIQTSHSINEKQLNLFDEAGRIVYSASFTNDNFSFSLRNQLAPGIYMCRITSNQKIIYSTKIVYQQP
jgi:hypothetical protein